MSPILLLLVGGSGGLLVGSIVGCHHGHRLLCWLLQHHRLLCWLLHHLHVRRVLLADEIHHGELRGHGHGCTYTAGLRHALHRVVRHLWELLWALLLLGATGGGRSTTARRGKDGLVHSGNRSAHDVGPRRVWVVCGSSIPARQACVGVVDVATMGAAVIPILPTLVGRGRARSLLRAGTVAAKPGWLLWEASCTICTARATVAPVVATAIVVLLLLWRGVDVGRGLLVDSHAELLDVRELALHSGHGGCLALH